MIHSIKMFNLLAQSKPRTKVKMSAYDSRILISKYEFKGLLLGWFVLLIF